MKILIKSKSFLLIIAITFLLIISNIGTFLFTSLLNSSNKYQTKESILGFYLMALEKQDKNLILQLVPSSYDASNEAQAKIDSFYGKKLGKYTAIYKPTENAYYGSFDIINEDKTFTDNIFIERNDDLYGQKWVLILGKNKDPNVSLIPASESFK